MRALREACLRACTFGGIGCATDAAEAVEAGVDVARDLDDEIIIVFQKELTTQEVI